MGVLSAVRKHAGATAVGVAVLLAGGGVATAVVVQPTSTTGEVFEVTESTAPATTEVPVPEVVPVAPPVEAPAPATVDAVTEPEPTAAPAPAPAPETIPAPQVNRDGSLPEGWSPPLNPGEPPIAPYTPPPPMEKLPGEPGYVQPGG